MALPVLTQNYARLQRNLLYTGLTRGKRLVVLVGQAKAVGMAVRNARGRQGWSKLKEWLRTERGRGSADSCATCRLRGPAMLRPCCGMIAVTREEFPPHWRHADRVLL